MGSAEEPEALQLLKPDAAPEDAPQPSPISPCSGEKGSCLQNITCGGRDLTMRNRCVNDLCAKESSQGGTMVDNPNQKALGADKKPSVNLAVATDAVALKDTGAGASQSGGEREITASGDLHHNSQQASSFKELPGISSEACSPLERKASPVAGEACRLLLAESCLKGANKDLPSAPASLKHVVFLEPTTHKAEAESVRAAGTACSKGGPELPAGLQNASQGQPPATEGDPLPPSHGDVCEAAERLTEGRGDHLATEATQESVPEPSAAESTSGKPGEPVTERDRLGPSREVRSPALETNTGGGCSTASEALLAAVPQGLSGESPTSPGKATKDSETEGLKETAAPSSIQCQTQAKEQQTPEAASTAVTEEQPVELLTKACTFEVTPPQQDAGTQAGHRVSLVSVAISPINPPDGSTAFTFHAGGLGPTISLKSPGPEQKPAKKDVEMQVSIPVETRSVATGPMTPVTKSPQASYPEVHVKGAQEETPEPVREVSWDEKGMTWEVYGASMEVEVLGMAIQKHLEKQIEEHGRQTVMTPQSTRSSSIKGPPHKGEVKRQPSVFRALLQNVRRPRCCSRGGPAME